MTDISQILTNSSGEAIVTFIFIFYLIKRDKEFSKTIKAMVKDFNDTISKHMTANSKAMVDLKNIIEKIYIQNKKLAKKVTKYEKGYIKLDSKGIPKIDD